MILATFVGALTVGIVLAAVGDAARLKWHEYKIQDHFFRVEEMFGQFEIEESLEFTRTEDTDVLTLESFQGSFLILNLWATWCRPCVSELPSLQLLQDYFGEERLKVVAVSLDPKHKLWSVRDFIEFHNLGTVSHYHDRFSQVEDTLGTGELPVTYIIAPDGQVLYRISGEGNWMNSDILEFVAKLKEVY